MLSTGALAARAGLRRVRPRGFAAVAAMRQASPEFHPFGFTKRTSRPAMMALQMQNLIPMTMQQVSPLSQTQTGLNARTQLKDRELENGFYLPAQFRSVDKVMRYALKEVVGSGFFATVYRAADTLNGKEVAVKVIAKAKCPREVFSNELKVLRYVQSFADEENGLNVVKDVYETNDKLFLVLELCSAGDLFDYVSAKGPLPEATVRTLMHKVLLSLDALHAHGVLHRDMKLENILLARKDSLDIRITDFGYSLLVDSTDLFRNPAGTFGYVAPEVLKSKQYSPACDMFSAGVVMYTLLAAHPPFPHITEPTSKSLSELAKIELEAITVGRADSAWRAEMSKPVFQQLSSAGRELLSSMLEINPAKRVSAKQALKHSWFEEGKRIEGTASNGDVSEETAEACASLQVA